MGGKGSGKGGARKGAGAKPKYLGLKLRRVTVNLPESVVADLDREAHKAGISRSEALQRRLVPEA